MSKLRNILAGIALLLLPTYAHGADVKISQLPLGVASTTNANDSFPFVDSVNSVTRRLKLSDLINIPAISSTFAPKANPTFTGTLTATTITATTFIGALTGNATTATALAVDPSPCSSGQFVTDIAANGTLTCGTPTGTGDVVGPSSSVDSEVVLFNGTTGKLIKRASGTGVAHLTSGVLSSSNVVLTSEVTGSLPIANGGTSGTTAATGFDALSPMTTLGDTLYGGASGTRTRLAGNTTTTKKMLSQTGDGTNSAAPSWAALVSGDIPNNAANTSGTAAIATTVTTTATNSTNASFFPAFVPSSSSGNQGVDTATGLSFNPSTNTLTTTTFAGALSGNATTATTATNATNGTTVATSTNASYFPLMAASSSNGNQPFNLGTGLTFNPSTNNLSTTTFTGALAGNATTATSATTATTATNATNGTTVAVSNNASYFPAMFASSSNGNQPFNLDSTFTYNPSTDTLTATTFAGNASTATTATNATNMATVAVSNNASYFPVLAASSTNSNQAHNLDTTFTYNPSTDTLTATTFAGNASTATTATNATNTAVTDDTTTNATMYPTWVTTTTGNLPQKVSSTKLRFNPSTSTLTATSFAGTATNATNIKTTLDNSTNSFLPILFTDSGSTTTQGAKVDDGPTKFGYNPSSGTLLLSGNVIGGNISGSNTGDVSIGNFGGSPNSTGLTMGSGQVLNLEAADISDPGGVSTTTQTFAGAKTFNDGLIAASTFTMPLQTASMVPVFDGSNNLISSSVTDTELGFLSGTTSNIQIQLSGKIDNTSNVIGNSLLAQMADGTVKGRAVGAGTGNPNDLALASAATASAVMVRDSSANVRANSFIDNYTTTATAAGTTTLTVGSSKNQYFTGSTTQTVLLPVTSTLVLGQQFNVINNSSGAVTVNSSGSNLVQTVAASSAGTYTVILTSGTSAASWSSTVAAGGTTSPLTTKGDVYVYSTTNARQAVGTNGQALIADSNQTNGVRYKDYTVKNYIINSDAEVGTETWTTYADAAGNTPVDMTGGSPSSTWTRSTSTPLAGSGAFLWTRTAANRQGEGVAVAIALDNGLQSSLVDISFDYKIISGTFFASDGITAPSNDGTTTQTTGNSDLEVFCYDVTNSVLIPVSPQYLTGTNATTNHYKGTLQTPSNSTSLRCGLHTARSTAVAFTAQFDNLYFGSHIGGGFGAPITDWAAYTPTFTGFGTASGIEIFYRRNGDGIDLTGKFTSGTSTAVEARMSLPTGMTSADTTKIGSIKVAGYGIRAVNDAAHYPTLIEPSVAYVTFGDQSASTAGLTKLNGNAFLASTDKYSFNAHVPIAGFSSQVSMSDTTRTAPTVQTFTSSTGTYTTPAGVKYIRVRMVGGGGGGGGSGTASGGTGGTGGNSTFGTSLLTANGGAGGGAPSGSADGGVGGTASLGTGPIGVAAKGGNGGGSFQQNGASSYSTGGPGAASPFGGSGGSSGYTTSNTVDNASTNSGSGGGGASAGTQSNNAGGGGGGAGGFIDAIISNPLTTYSYAVGAAGTAGTAGTSGAAGGAGGSGYIIVEEYYRSEGSIAATDPVGFRYYASSTSISSSLATVSWTTKDWDTHSGMSSGTYTVPASGKYQCNASIKTAGTIVLNNTVILELQKNGTVVTRDTEYAAAAVTNLNARVSDLVSAVAGDTLRIQVSSGATTPSIASSNFENYFSCNRMGN